MLSIIIPAHNEAQSIGSTVRQFHVYLKRSNINHEFIVVNDHSIDNTAQQLQKLGRSIRGLRSIDNPLPRGFGFAVRTGIEYARGEYVALVMADQSDRPIDLVHYYRKAQEGFDCVFGSRFISGGKIIDYPIHKLLLNRVLNNAIRILFRIPYNDTTNAFKLYRKSTLDGLKPFLSHHYNLTVELPLKAIIRGYSYAIVPNWWINRKKGTSKLKIKEMGSRYLFIVFYCLLEKWLSQGDYWK